MGQSFWHWARPSISTALCLLFSLKLSKVEQKLEYMNHFLGRATAHIHRHRRVFRLRLNANWAWAKIRKSRETPNPDAWKYTNILRLAAKKTLFHTAIEVRSEFTAGAQAIVRVELICLIRKKWSDSRRRIHRLMMMKFNNFKVNFSGLFLSYFLNFFRNKSEDICRGDSLFFYVWIFFFSFVIKQRGCCGLDIEKICSGQVGDWNCMDWFSQVVSTIFDSFY